MAADISLCLFPAKVSRVVSWTPCITIREEPVDPMYRNQGIFHEDPMYQYSCVIPSEMPYSLRKRSHQVAHDDLDDNSDRDVSDADDDHADVDFAEPEPVPDDSSGSESENDELENQLGVDDDDDGSDEDENERDEASRFRVYEVSGVQRGRDDTVWTSLPAGNRGRPLSENIVLSLPGPRGESRGITSAVELWNLFLPDEMIQEIVDHTNTYMQRNPVEGRYAGPTSLVEMRAFIGLLYLAGLQKAGKLSVQELWNTKFSGTMYRSTSSERRFEHILASIRFDDRHTRDVRRQTEGRLAPIHRLFSFIVSRYQTLYSPSPEVTIDEQLYPTRGRCPFKTYIPSKPDKYGIQCISLCDSRTYYVYNAMIYTGKGSTPDGIQQAQYFVETLMKPLENTNRNVTFDNRFTSLRLVQNLKKKKLTAVGTVRKNRRELPSEATEQKDRQLNSGKYFSNGSDVTLLSYIPKKKGKKVVVLMSSMHKGVDKAEEENRTKPTMIEFYNKTKGGVDSHDQLSHAFTVIRKTNRWPLLVFYGLLDSIAINAMVLLRMNTGNRVQRRPFLHDLIESLIRPQLRARLLIPQTPRVVVSWIRDILGETAPQQQPPPDDGSKKRCEFCPRRTDRKTKNRCAGCRKPICGEHSLFACNDCVYGD